ncbi:MAG: diguanylate cyclase [Cellvibrionaceae bacterium]|nr:diguanylate cyclase [Cellvibrionaceae bacterium]
MASSNDMMNDFRWILDVVQNVDVGLVLLDQDYKIQLWNSFMQNHSATAAEMVINQSLFSIFPEIDEKWFRRKAESVYLLKNSAFTTWEQRPYLFRFENYRPITGKAEFMYQNTTFIPIQSLSGETDGICLIVYDVTEQAVNHLAFETANEQLEIISQTDGLTGLLNRKTWEDRFEKEFERLQRYDENATVIIFDIDHFKKINDGYGHPAGDEVIRQTANIVQHCLRKTDVAGRYGGEEYIIFLPHTAAEDAIELTERIRIAIASTPAYYDKQEMQYTVSLGIADYSPTLTSPTAWIDAADQALYQSKQGGRNQYHIFQHPRGC